jgi:leader peptidase (prepilin peptidase)/N-methyltransferase
VILIAIFLVTLSFAIAIAVYDIRHKSVPLVWLLLMSIFGVGFIILEHVFIPSSSFGQWLLAHISGLIIAVPFFLIWVLSRGRYIGFADVEIITWIGLMLGVRLGISAVLISFYMGAFFAIGYIIFKKIRGYSYSRIRKIQIPFAPFLLVGFFVVAIIGLDVITLLSRGYL